MRGSVCTAQRFCLLLLRGHDNELNSIGCAGEKATPACLLRSALQSHTELRIGDHRCQFRSAVSRSWEKLGVHEHRPWARGSQNQTRSEIKKVPNCTFSSCCESTGMSSFLRICTLKASVPDDWDAVYCSPRCLIIWQGFVLNVRIALITAVVTLSLVWNDEHMLFYWWEGGKKWKWKLTFTLVSGQNFPSCFNNCFQDLQSIVLECQENKANIKDFSFN